MDQPRKFHKMDTGCVFVSAAKIKCSISSGTTLGRGPVWIPIQRNGTLLDPGSI